MRDTIISTVATVISAVSAIVAAFAKRSVNRIRTDIGGTIRRMVQNERTDIDKTLDDIKRELAKISPNRPTGTIPPAQSRTFDK